MKRGALISRGPTADWHKYSTIEVSEGWNDDAVLVPEPTRPAQLRPLLPAERQPGRQWPGGMMLVCKSTLPEFRAFVRLSRKHRANTAENVELAIRQVDKVYPQIGRIFRDAMATAESAPPPS